ncbi:phosphatidylinositol-specific phospholipase C/glycerophosphodiester phosphodiesterase family protein [Bremerella sp. JC817]|uniref:phosphatidylinositol-specific phospholipase C/glycerophosphodiester phosphodiesterase family protein n=1 Tax=Bremerella sp. JC817 TaxID=3231756 RepID=UPI00345A93BD
MLCSIDRIFSAVLLATALFAASAFGQTPLPQAHAHNDYYHKRPLLDALDQGFCNVEADIYLVQGQLLVGHERWELRTNRSLTSLYLDPLKERIEANGGHVYETPKPFILMIDIKTNGEEVYAALEKLLAQYDFISVTEDGKHQEKAVTVVISGDRPKKAVAEANPRRVGLDGRLSDLNANWPAELMPVISDKWGSHFKWKGQGPMPDAEQAKLKEIVEKTHAKGRQLRFWGTPEDPKFWAMLQSAGVDLIGTDDLEKLSEFLNHSDSSTPE